MPDRVARGHRVGEHGATREVVVRADSAGMTEGFLSSCRAATCASWRRRARAPRSQRRSTTRASSRGSGERAVTKHGELRCDAHVAELTELVDLRSLPEGTRLIVRREPLHQGAQRSLFPSLDFRYWGFVTDLDGDVASSTN